MGFLQQDTNNIILDAVLTNEGRKRLAANDGSFRVVAFSLGDDEVDYGVIERFGRAVGREKIEKNTPIFEALTDSNLESRSRLVTVSDPNLIALATYDLSATSLSFSNIISSNLTTETLTVKMKGASNQDIPQEIQDSVLVVSVDRRYMSLNGQIPFQSVDNVDYYNVVGQTTSNQSIFSVNLRPKQLLDSDFTTFGSNTDKTTISTFVRVQGRQSGITKDVTVTLNKNS